MTRAIAAVREPPRPIAVNLVLPYGRRVLGIDPVSSFLGAPLEVLLASIMRQPRPYVRRDEATRAVLEVFPLYLPDGEGAAVNLGLFGELGFANDGGVLVLTLPSLVGREAIRTFGDTVVGVTNVGSLIELRVRLRTGMRRAFSVGALGELAIEAG